MLLLCRAGRLSAAAALDPAFKSTGSRLVQVIATGPRDVTLTLRKGHAFQRYRCFCVSVGGVDATTLAHLEKQLQRRDRQPVQHRDSPGALHWGYVDRVAARPPSLPERVRSQGGNVDFITQPLAANGRHRSGGAPAGNGLFTGAWGVSSRLCSTGTMQTRASSTKTSDAGGQQAADNKGGGQNLKEASTAYSSPGKVQVEPEGGKLSKTQQLKKVFKEYGAVGVSFHIGISLMSLGMFYLLISSGIDMTALLCKVGFSEAVVQSKMAAGTSTFVLAYAIHKLFAPVRISITLVSVPLIVRYFRKTGHFKPPTPAP